MSKKRSVKQCGIRNHTTGVLNDNAYALLSLIVSLIMILRRYPIDNDLREKMKQEL